MSFVFFAIIGNTRYVLTAVFYSVHVYAVNIQALEASD